MEDIGLTIHPHPTLSEIVAAEIAEGSITDLYLPRKNKAGLILLRGRRI